MHTILERKCEVEYSMRSKNRDTRD